MNNLNQQTESTVFTHTIRATLAKGDVLATEHTMHAVSRALELRAQIKFMTEQLDKEKEIIIAQTGKNGRLVDAQGFPVATYKQNAPSEVIDKKKLQDKYPDIYNMVADLKEGSWNLRFEK